MWYKYVTRRLAVQASQAWNYSWGDAMKKVYGVSVTKTLVFRDKTKTDYYVDQKQHEIYVAGLYKLLDSAAFLKIFHGQAQQSLESILAKTQKKFDQDLSKLSNAELLRIYKNFVIQNSTQFYIRMWAVFNIAAPLTNVVLEKLNDSVSNKKANEYLLNLSSPLKPNDVLMEHIDLLKLAAQKSNLSEPNFLKKLKIHTKNFQHIPMFDFDHEPYKEEHFLSQLKQIKNPQRELKELEKLFEGRKKEFDKILRTIKPDKKFRLQLIFLKENIFLRDYRDSIRQKFNIELKKFYSEIAKRLGLSIKDVATLTNDEIINHLQQKKSFSKSEVSKRAKAYLLIQKGKKMELYSGGQALDRAKQELKNTTISNKANHEFSGRVGSPGKVRGRVRIICTNRDLPKVKKGDVLVAAMTRQDFVPAMRKAVAIITDEGSVASHAAIIARELNVPCIVGTRIATQVLKDGDRVEVDANKGVVRKI